MRIGIDCRMAGTGEGIARYVEELVKNLAIIDKTNQYFLICSDQFPIANFQFPKNFKIIKTESPYYSFAEQTRFIWELLKFKLDLVHFPSFNVPIFYPGKFVVTIHDLIHHYFPGKKKSRFFHRLAYRLVIWTAVSRAKKIIAVSNQTKADLIKNFKVPPAKISIIDEGVNPSFGQKTEIAQLKILKEKYQLFKPYLLFVGVWRQYKNIPRLIRAFEILLERYDHDIELVLVGKIDQFYPEIKEAVLGSKYASRIKPLGFVSDADLVALYQAAAVFVLPSLFEGFGLIGLEAQAAGAPVAASSISVIKEILGEGAVYFNPGDGAEIAKAVDSILADQVLAKRLSEFGRANITRYNWERTAKETLAVYQET